MEQINLPDPVLNDIQQLKKEIEILKEKIGGLNV